jgi:hypothetical protein
MAAALVAGHAALASVAAAVRSLEPPELDEVPATGLARCAPARPPEPDAESRCSCSCCRCRCRFCIRWYAHQGTLLTVEFPCGTALAGVHPPRPEVPRRPQALALHRETLQQARAPPPPVPRIFSTCSTTAAAAATTAQPPRCTARAELQQLLASTAAAWPPPLR